MTRVSFKPPKALIIPIVPAMAAGGALIILESNTDKGLLLALILAPFYYLGLEILFRRVGITDRGVTIHKFLRTSHVAWPEIRSLDAARTGNKIFIIIQTDAAIPMIISNTIDHFNELSGIILKNIPENKIDPSVHEILSDPGRNRGPIFQAWVVLAVVTGVLFFRLILG
jgi:hypothetical protein